MLHSIRFMLLIGLLLHIPAAQAAFSPLSISIIPPVQFPPGDFSIVGARVSAGYGQQRNIYGLDLGVVGNITDLEFAGLALAGGFNYTKGSTTILGLQLAGVANVNTQKTLVFGVQLAAGLNENTAESSIVGLQLAMVNLSDHSKIFGVQAGVYNRAESVYGFQIGLVNDAKNLHGVQIGLLNFNRTGLLAVSPLLNAGF